jgi:hypothetical protein
MTFEQTTAAPTTDRRHRAPRGVLAAVKSRKEESVYDIARAAFHAAAGDVKRAARIMQRRVTVDKALLTALSEEFIRIVCEVTTRGVLRHRRRVVWLPPNYDKGGKGARVTALAAGNRLIYFPLPGGKVLADASAAEVRAAAAFYTLQARDMGWKARWLRAVAQRVPEGKTVKEALTEKALTKLKAEALNVKG